MSVLRKNFVPLLPLSLVICLLLGGCSGSGEDPRETDSPFGMLAFLEWNHEWNKYHYPTETEIIKAAKLMQEAGVGIVRMDFLWDDIEPERRKFNFKKYDTIVRILDEHGIKILGLLNYNAPWAAQSWNSAPNPEHYTRYAEKVVRRYRKKIKYWEIWNEPDDKLYWQPQDYMKSYTALLKKVYPAMKRADKTCVVVMGGIAKFIPQSLKHIYQNGGKDYFDVVNCHPFQDPRLASSIGQLEGTYNSLRRVMAAYGDADKDVWFTEMGCPGVDFEEKTYGWWLGVSPSEQLQAAWMERVYRKSFQLKGLKKVFWAFFRDMPDFFDSSVNEFGIVKLDFTPKPAYKALQQITQDYYKARAAEVAQADTPS